MIRLAGAWGIPRLIKVDRCTRWVPARKTSKRVGLVLTATLSTAAVHALPVSEWRPDAVFVQVGKSLDGVEAVGGGAAWKLRFAGTWLNSELTAQTELFGSMWLADGIERKRRSYVQLGALPLLRSRFERGASPWFLETGIGGSWTSRLLRTSSGRQFSTRWNFYDTIGVGYTIESPRGKSEIGARWVHISNGGFGKPNPGLNMLQLRYIAWF